MCVCMCVRARVPQQIDALKCVHVPSQMRPSTSNSMLPGRFDSAQCSFITCALNYCRAKVQMGSCTSTGHRRLRWEHASCTQPVSEPVAAVCHPLPHWLSQNSQSYQNTHLIAVARAAATVARDTATIARDTATVARAAATAAIAGAAATMSRPAWRLNALAVVARPAKAVARLGEVVDGKVEGQHMVLDHLQEHTGELVPQLLQGDIKIRKEGGDGIVVRRQHGAVKARLVQLAPQRIHPLHIHIQHGLEQRQCRGICVEVRKCLQVCVTCLSVCACAIGLRGLRPALVPSLSNPLHSFTVLQASEHTQHALHAHAAKSSRTRCMLSVHTLHALHAYAVSACEQQTWPPNCPTLEPVLRPACGHITAVVHCAGSILALT